MKILYWYVSKILSERNYVITITYLTNSSEIRSFSVKSAPNTKIVTVRLNNSFVLVKFPCGGITKYTETLFIITENSNDFSEFDLFVSNRYSMNNVRRCIYNDVILNKPIKTKENIKMTNNAMTTGPIIKFAKMYPGVKIPTKRREDAGYDVYPYFSERYIVIPPNRTVIINTGLMSSFSSDYYIKLQERGSTGTRGMAQRSGIIDSGYRGEWMVPITNTNSNRWIVIKKTNEELTHDDYFDMYRIHKYTPNSVVMNGVPDNIIIYPYEKAICQFTIERNYYADIREVSVEDIKKDISERGSGRIGSSGK